MESARASVAPFPARPLLPPRLRLLGGCELLLGESQQRVDFPYDKTRLLLAVLALEARPLPRERLAELLWPQSEGEQARANLRRALFDLRRLLQHPELGGEALLSDKKQLALNPGLDWRLDSREFGAELPLLRAEQAPAPLLLQDLEARLDLYRGPLLDGLELDGLQSLQDWLAPQREALAQTAGRLARRLSQGWELAGRAGRALSAARRGLQLDPWNEALLRTCLRLQAERERPAALAQFEQFRQRLQQALGLQPEAETLALVEQLRRAPVGGSASATPVHPSERRRIVALACELEPAPGTDTETLSQELPALQARLREILQAHGGFVLRAEGGEMLAFFGHPRALEQAPRRALAAALALQERLCGTPRRPGRLCPRLGLEAGWVYADPRQGSPDGAGTLSRQARRLALLAEPGEIRLGAGLGEQAPTGFRLTPLEGGGARLLGPDEPMSQPRSTPLVGRQRELAVLLQAWRQPVGRSQALLVQAEPGLGKTRLLQALLEQGEAGMSGHLLLSCLPEFQHSPYHPFIDCLQQRLAALQVQHAEEGPAAQRRLLAAVSPSLREQQPRLERLLQGGGAAAPASEARAEPDRHADESLLLAALGLGRSGGPDLLLVEDLHWADPSSLGLLARLRRQEQAPRLMLLSSRDPAPAALPELPTLVLEPLPPSQMQRLIAHLDLAEPAQAEAVLQRAEGVPLYAEELARALQQAPQEPMPARLWDLLAARLERVGPAARRLAQAASVIGTHFQADLLHWLHREDEGAPQSALLQELLGAGLLQIEGQGWRFRHALLRDAAYQSLAPSPRRALHRRLAEGLRGPFASLGAESPELLAAQLMAAEEALAAHYWLLAGRRAAALSAHVEACHHFRQGLQALGLPDGASQAALALPLELGLGFALMATEGYGSQAARQGFERALAGAATQPAARFQALWGLWLGSRSGTEPAPPTGERALALRQAQGLVEEARAQGDAAAAVQAAYAMGNNLLFLGRLGEAGRWLERAMHEARGLNGGALLGRFGEHGGVTAAGLRCWVLALQGRVEDALQQAEQTLSAARALRHAHTEAYALATVGVMHQRLRQPVLAQRRAEELRRLALAHDMVLWQAVAGLVGGWAQAAQGDAAGLAPIRQAAAMAAVAMPSTEATFLSLLADAQLALGRHAEALACVDEALPKARQRQEDYLEPELWRLRALAQAGLGQGAAEVRRDLARALRRAREMRAELLLLRALGSRLAWRAGSATLRRSLGLRLRRLSGLATLADGREAAALSAGSAFNAESTLAP
ncbi:UNVERIFIED_ORG: AAA family ATPase [Shinella sp. XGS7]|nr:AAA family ATPase [Shinella sp. XGS7]